MFTAIDGVLIRPLPYPHGSQLMFLGEKSKTGEINWTSWPNWRDLQQDSKSFEGIGGCLMEVAILQGR